RRQTLHRLRLLRRRGRPDRARRPGRAARRLRGAPARAPRHHHHPAQGRGGLTHVEPRTIVDTTTDSRWTHVRATAHLAEPIINLDGHACHLDGPAAFAAYLAYTDRHGHHSLPPMGRDSVVDFALPLATWTAPAPGPVHQLARAATPGHVWGWACSAAAAA